MQSAHLNILMIDDDEQDVEIVRELLKLHQNFPLDLLHCATPTSGLELLQSDPNIDLILLDLCCSETASLVFFRQIHQAFPTIPLVIVSPHQHEAIALKAMQEGAQDYLIKGRFTSSHLRRSIHYALERQNLLLELDTKNQILQSLSTELDLVYQTVEQLTTIDELTQVNNRRCFDEVFLVEWNRLCRENQPLSLIICDIDQFKAYNEAHSQEAGDNCLRAVAQTIAKVAKRPADCVTRYGGDEFAIILPNTDLSGATQVAKAMQAAILSLKVPNRESSICDHITLSLGVASQVPDEDIAPSLLIEAADRALYVAKQQGRDRIQTHQKDCTTLESRRTLELVSRLQLALNQQKKQRRGHHSRLTHRTVPSQSFP